MKETSNVSAREYGSIPHRHVFSLEEANRTLPLVKLIVADVVTLYRQMAAVQQRLASDSLPAGEREGVEFVAEQQEERFERYMEELRDVGCELKDANMGLVDFIGRHEGREVYLCWRQGEDQIQYWHELHAGFAGRRPVGALHDGLPGQLAQ